MRKIFLFLLLSVLGYAAGATCTAGFNWTPAQTNGAPLRVKFTSTASWSGGPATVYGMTKFYYGDGTNSFGSVLYHNYATPGTYTVSQVLYVRDSMNNNSLYCSDSTSQQITISYQPCAGDFSYTITGNSTVNFTGVNLANTPGAVFSWHFGDGNYGSTSSPSHTYAANGVYTVKMVISAGGCVDTVVKSVTISNAPFNCSNLHAAFTDYVSNATVYFYNSSTASANHPQQLTWSFGDGTASSAYNPVHTYAAAGTYTVHLYVQWMDSLSNTLLCSDSVTHTVTIAAAPNVINGLILVDSTNTPSLDSFKVWLIVHDSVNGTLYAVDSLTTGGYWIASYSFYNKPAGNYLIKAAMLNQAAGTNGYVPTYYDSSIYWNQAINAYHSGGTSGYFYIYMRKGIVTSGPGFIGGNISQGANKGTNGGIEGILVYLEDQGGKLIGSTYTDFNGDYSFSNIPLGTYTIYPEAMNYATTPIYNVVLTAGNTSATGNNFGQNSTEIKPKSTGVTTVTTTSYVAYPNPASSKVSIRWAAAPSEAQITISDVAGHKVYETAVRNASAVTDVNVSQLQSGIYFMQVKTNSGTHTDKLVIQH